MKMIQAFTLLLAIATNCNAFTVTNTNVRFGKATISTSSQLDALLSIDLEKPLGIVLEEMEENAPKGVKVEELSDAGSAYASQYRDQLIGLKLAQVGETDVTNMAFDDVMNCIINAASPVNISFEVPDEPAVQQFNMGTVVQIKVIQEGNPDVTIDAKVGDNLRKTLLENKVELYRGLKKKLGNCGGQGQCTFCAVDFVEGEGWQERSDYENKKIAKLPPNARLACMNNIQGPATIRIQ